jgi:riboflavin synthase
MFTGIIEEIGIVRLISRDSNSAKLGIESKVCFDGTKESDSISVNGCCLTLVKKDQGILFFDVSHETLRASNLSDIKEGEKVNLERSLTPNGRMGGHFVTGHIDYKVRLISKADKGDFIEFTIGINDGYQGFIAQKGSVAVDGISLTVNDVTEKSFKVMLIPYTLECTTLQYKKRGSILNIEIDILSKYVYSFLNKKEGQHLPRNSISKNFLSEHGFI